MAEQTNLKEMHDFAASMLGKAPISTQSGIGINSDFGIASRNTSQGRSRFDFVRSLTSLFGFQRTDPNKAPSKNNMQFVKVDQASDLRIAQAKVGKLFKTKMGGKLSELFDSWLQDTTDTYKILEDRNKRLSELEFAIANDPFLSMAANLYADEATQIDVQGNLIDIETNDPRMKERMEDLISQWGITQNRLRSVAYQLAAFGDAFWANKVTKAGVVRITPINIHQVKERLEFNPVQVQTDISLRKGYVTAINRSQKLKALFDTMENKENEEFADLFDSRLFGFAIDDDMVVPPWAITHFRLNVDQSEFSPMGRSVFLNALAPFRQCNATMVLQSLARVMSFPVTVYGIKTQPGMDEALQFERINEVREAYENTGDTGAGNEAFSVNTKLWVPQGLIELEMHSPQIDISATEDIEMYQDRVAIASGVPKGYLVQEWGGYGNSAISLIEQFKPFARKVFTVQTAMLDGLSNLFRLHFAITGEFDYKTDFVLSLKFPNEESSDERLQAKQGALTLSKDVLDTIASVVDAIDAPLPGDVIQDILRKYSFIDADDIKKWVKRNPNATEEDQEAEELGAESGGGSIGGGGGGDLGGEDLGMEAPEGGEEGRDIGAPEGESSGDTNQDFVNTGKLEARRAFLRMQGAVLREERDTVISKRYFRMQEAITQTINEKIIRTFEKLDEGKSGQRHFKFSHVEACNIPMYELFTGERRIGITSLQEGEDSRLGASSHIGQVLSEIDVDLHSEKYSWGKIKEALENPSLYQEEDAKLDRTFNFANDWEKESDDYESKDDDEIRKSNMLKILN